MFITVACPEKSRKKMILILYILYQKKRKNFQGKCENWPDFRQNLLLLSYKKIIFTFSLKTAIRLSSGGKTYA